MGFSEVCHNVLPNRPGSFLPDRMPAGGSSCTCHRPPVLPSALFCIIGFFCRSAGKFKYQGTFLAAHHVPVTDVGIHDHTGIDCRIVEFFCLFIAGVTQLVCLMGFPFISESQMSPKLISAAWAK